MPVQKSALIVVDMLNTYEHEDGEPLKESARQVVPVIASLLEKAREQDTLIVYVNDNHGDWTAGHSKLVEQSRRGGSSSAARSPSSASSTQRSTRISASSTSPSSVMRWRTSTRGSPTLRWR